ncbi:hypothetical protein Btru_017453 [Bulinus truncatus]|nr:hypothetical protein Btru_017453 [Bulinus truncatus]
MRTHRDSHGVAAWAIILTLFFAAYVLNREARSSIDADVKFMKETELFSDADSSLKSLRSALMSVSVRNRSDNELLMRNILTGVENLKLQNDQLMTDIEHKENVISFLSRPITNPVRFEYDHNPKDACGEKKLKAIFLVPSRPENFAYRDKVRLSDRGRYVNSPENNARMIFVVGRNTQSNGSYEKLLREEIKTYGDVVLVEINDTYTNIRMKSMSMLHWATTHCANAEFFIRTDDDVKVNASEIVSALVAKRRSFRNFVLGVLNEGWEPVRDKKNKYYLSVEEYPHSTLPPFAIGGLLGFPMETASLLYQCGLRLKPIWLDDVFLTGLCAPEVGVPLLSDENFVFKHWDW